jgi:hypothetical protein
VTTNAATLDEWWEWDDGNQRLTRWRVSTGSGFYTIRFVSNEASPPAPAEPTSTEPHEGGETG